jgi:hypothetical protein
VLTAKRELGALVVEPIFHEAFDGMTALAGRLRKTGALVVPARVVRVAMAGGAAGGEWPEPHRLTRSRGKKTKLAPMARGAI